MSGSSDDEIGNQAEQEYENEEPIKKKSHSKGLPTGERARIIADAINNKQDPYYSATNKNGKWIVRKRKTPLEIIEEEVSPNIGETPSAENQEDQKPNDKNNDNKKKEIKQQFFTMQSTINEDLKKSLDLVNERCIKIEKKYEKLKREKAKRKIEKEKNINRKQVKFESPEEEEQKEQPPEERQITREEFYDYISSLPPYARGRYININEF